MAIHQTMSGQAFDQKVKRHIQNYASAIANEEMPLADTHALLMSGTLDLFQIAALAKAIACFQLSA